LDKARRYAGPVAAVEPQGLYGGTCTLHFGSGQFELQVWRHWIYGIEDTDTVRGTFVPSHAGADLDVREWHNCHVESNVVESSVALARTWQVRHAGPTEDPSAIVALRFALGADAFDVLLLREGDGDAQPAPAIAASFEQACATRQAEADATRERRTANARRDQRAAQSAQAFAAGDFPSVVALLAPAESELSRAESMRLALARQRMRDRE
jgi:hypothetical protein